MVFKYMSALSIIVYFLPSLLITFQIKSQEGHFPFFVIFGLIEESNCPGGSMAEAHFEVANTIGQCNSVIFSL